MSGCAKRNADRELARVVAFIEKRIEYERASVESGEIVRFDRVSAVTASLGALHADLSARRHRDLTPALPAPPPASRIGDQVEYLPEVKP